MSNSKHTPGDWDFACDSYAKVRHSRKACVYTTINTPTGEQIVHVASRIPSWEDARLIAAVKDLFAALETLVEIERRDNLTDPDVVATDAHRKASWDAARAAIVKASPPVITPANMTRIAERDDSNDIATLLLS